MSVLMATLLYHKKLRANFAANKNETDFHKNIRVEKTKAFSKNIQQVTWRNLESKEKTG